MWRALNFHNTSFRSRRSKPLRLLSGLKGHVRAAGYFLKSQWLSLQELKELQNRNLRATIRYANQNISFYRKLYTGLAVEEIRTIDDLEKLPVITRSEVRKAFPEEIVSHSYPLAQCSIMQTSGSTDSPLTIAQDWSCREVLGGLAPRIFDAIKIEPTDRSVHIYRAEAGEKQRKTSRYSFTNFAKMYGEMRYGSYLLGLRTRSLFFEDPSELSKDIQRLSPSLIIGSPSNLRALVECLPRDGKGDGGVRKLPTLKAIYSTADPLLEQDQAFLSSGFGCPVYDVYGSRETGVVSWQCSESPRGFMHLNLETVTTELLKDGARVASGERGDIALTTLYNRAMPLIRYRIGDSSIMTDERCACGRGLPLLGSVDRSNYLS